MIRFKAVKKNKFACEIVDDPPHTEERARWSDGHWSDICTRHMEIFRKNCDRAKPKLWFLGKKT